MDQSAYNAQLNAHLAQILQNAPLAISRFTCKTICVWKIAQISTIWVERNVYHAPQGVLPALLTLTALHVIYPIMFKTVIVFRAVLVIIIKVGSHVCHVILNALLVLALVTVVHA